MDNITITISNESFMLALEALRAISEDKREPRRYRKMYQKARYEFQDALVLFLEKS